LIALLAASAAWVAIDLRSPPGPTAAKSPAPAASQDADRSAPPASQEKQPGIPSRSVLGKFAADPFSAQSWMPRPKPAAIPAPPVPVAPPLPFRFAGQFHRESGMEVYVARGEEIFPVKQGETLDGQYKVDSVSTTEVSFVHLPTGTRQTLQFSALRDQELTARGGPPPPRAPASTAASPPPPAPMAKLVPAPPPLSDNPNPGKAEPAQLRWEGPTSTKAGSSFNVSLRVTSGEQIRAAPMQVRFDPSVLESVSVRPGRYFSADKTGSFGYRVNSDGSIFVGVSNQAPTPASDAEMLILTFKSIKAAAAAEISVSSLNLQGAAGRAIAYGGLTPFRTTITP
jgi:hypothetical protein